MDDRKARVTLKDTEGQTAARGYIKASRLIGSTLLKRKGIVYAITSTNPLDVEAHQTAYPLKITEF